MVKVKLVSQPRLSITVTVQTPEHNCETELVPCPTAGCGFHRYVIAPLPPLTSTEILPSHEPLQELFATSDVVVSASGSAISTLIVVSQPEASVIETVYTPAQSPETEEVPSPVIGSGAQSKT